MRSGVVALIAKREITSRVRQKGFRVGFGLALLIIVIAAVLPSFFSSSNGPTSYDVGVAASAPGFQDALTAVGKTQDVKVTVHSANAAEATKKVRDGDWDAAVLPGSTLIAEGTGDKVVGVVQSAYRLSQTVRNLGDAGLSSQQATRALSVTPLKVSSTKSSDSNQREAIAIITVLVLFTQLATFCTWVAMGVVEEKASRVVELILSSVRPLQLLAGKLIGIGALAAGQVLIIGMAALVAATAAGTISIPASALLTVLVAFVGFVLGFAFFAAIAAALGSTVSRQEEVSGILTPMTLFLFVCYGAAFATASSPESTFARVLSIVPPLSSISMPARIAHGGVPVLDVVLAVVLLVATAFGALVVAARIYRASILQRHSRTAQAGLARRGGRRVGLTTSAVRSSVCRAQCRRTSHRRATVGSVPSVDDQVGALTVRR